MAIYHISINKGSKGAAAEHARYIQREGRFTAEVHGAVLGSGCANFPGWCHENRLAFWRASDRFERANGSTYREYELALPRELSRRAQLLLVRRFAEGEFGNTRPYQWAMYSPRGPDGEERPQARVMFSDRQLDGIDRGPEQFFKRYNAKAPYKGGARKLSYGNKLEAAQVYQAIRARWALVQNDALAAAGLELRVDHRSLRDQGIVDREPGVHRGRVVNAIEARGEISEVGERKRRQRGARIEGRSRLVAELVALDREEAALLDASAHERG